MFCKRVQIFTRAGIDGRIRLGEINRHFRIHSEYFSALFQRASSERDLKPRRLETLVSNLLASNVLTLTLKCISRQRSSSKLESKRVCGRTRQVNFERSRGSVEEDADFRSFDDPTTSHDQCSSDRWVENMKRNVRKIGFESFHRTVSKVKNNYQSITIPTTQRSAT